MGAAAAAGERRAQAARQEEARRRAKVEEMLRRDRERRDGSRAQYEAWGQRFEGGFRAQGGFRAEWDAQTVEEMMRAMQGMMGGMGVGARGGGGGAFDARRVAEVLREFERAAGRGGERARDFDFDAARFWEQMEGARWRDAGAGAEGVFSRQAANRHYAALGVAHGAPMDEVKRAYRRLVMRWHPDRYRGGDRAEAERRFREITTAYEALAKK